ncbi:hypothetical protein Taro_044066, partial [Colocasia esculenta]|nr:hypothetical protein [Colocasia esculenta]
SGHESFAKSTWQNLGQGEGRAEGCAGRVLGTRGFVLSGADLFRFSSLPPWQVGSILLPPPLLLLLLLLLQIGLFPFPPPTNAGDWGLQPLRRPLFLVCALICSFRNLCLVSEARRWNVVGLVDSGGWDLGAMSCDLRRDALLSAFCSFTVLWIGFPCALRLFLCVAVLISRPTLLSAFYCCGVRISSSLSFPLASCIVGERGGLSLEVVHELVLTQKDEHGFRHHFLWG